ncbi:MAG: hypothetical protein LBF93_07965 [Zoogloeaceae bacterium]|nr:hypothetical protein [Zoogloeaceae bacterium]
MSFDLFLHRFEAGEPAQADRSGILALLRKHCQDTEDPFGFYRVRFPDDSGVAFSAEGLASGKAFTGCAFHMRGFSFTPSVISFVFEVAVAGDMVIFNAQGKDTPDNPLAILTRSCQSSQFPSDCASNPVLCSSASDLARLLGIGFGEWSDFRDLVIGKPTSAPRQAR